MTAVAVNAMDIIQTDSDAEILLSSLRDKLMTGDTKREKLRASCNAKLTPGNEPHLRLSRGRTCGLLPILNAEAARMTSGPRIKTL